MNNINRVKSSSVQKGNSSGTTIFQNILDENLYYKTLDDNTHKIVNQKTLDTSTEILEEAINKLSDTVAAMSYTYAEIPISNDQILALGSRGVTSDILVPKGMYPEIDSIFLEFTPRENPYSIGTITYISLRSHNAVEYSGDIGILTEENPCVLKLVEESFLSGDSSYNAPSEGTEPLFVLSTGDGGLGENPTLGDGTALLKIKYRFKSFGS